MHDEPTTLGGDGKPPQINLGRYDQQPPPPSRRGCIHFAIHVASWVCVIIAAYIVWRVTK
jgi:hypothetical protein